MIHSKILTGVCIIGNAFQICLGLSGALTGIFRDHMVNIMAADALAPRVDKNHFIDYAE